MNLPDEVKEILDALLAGLRRELGDRLVGVYLRGSLATGDFLPETSDVDLLAVTEQAIGDAEFDALARLHAQIAALPNRYANRIEMAYVDRAALRRFQPGLRHATLGQGASLEWAEHHANWILERWTLRERGVVLHGPNPATLVEPVTNAELTEAVRSRLNDWAEWAETQDEPEWRAPRRSAAAYVVETMCRALYTLARKELSSKARAVEWALETLEEPWRSTVERSRAWRTDATTDAGVVPEVVRLVIWAASRANARAAWDCSMPK